MMSPHALRFLRVLCADGAVREWYAAPFIRTVGAKTGLNEPQAIAAAGELERLGLALTNLRGHVRLTSAGMKWRVDHGL